MHFLYFLHYDFIEAGLKQGLMSLASHNSSYVSSFIFIEITNINLCEAPELNDCSVNAACMDGDGIGYICVCMEGYMDIFPESLPGRYCVEGN